MAYTPTELGVQAQEQRPYGATAAETADQRDRKQAAQTTAAAEPTAPPRVNADQRENRGAAGGMGVPRVGGEGAGFFSGLQDAKDPGVNSALDWLQEKVQGGVGNVLKPLDWFSHNIADPVLGVFGLTAQTTAEALDPELSHVGFGWLHGNRYVGTTWAEGERDRLTKEQGLDRNNPLHWLQIAKIDAAVAGEVWRGVKTEGADPNAPPEGPDVGVSAPPGVKGAAEMLNPAWGLTSAAGRIAGLGTRGIANVGAHIPGMGGVAGFLEKGAPLVDETVRSLGLLGSERLVRGAGAMALRGARQVGPLGGEVASSLHAAGDWARELLGNGRLAKPVEGGLDLLAGAIEKPTAAVNWLLSESPTTVLRLRASHEIDGAMTDLQEYVRLANAKGDPITLNELIGRSLGDTETGARDLAFLEGIPQEYRPRLLSLLDAVAYRPAAREGWERLMLNNPKDASDLVIRDAAELLMRERAQQLGVSSAKIGERAGALEAQARKEVRAGLKEPQDILQDFSARAIAAIPVSDAAVAKAGRGFFSFWVAGTLGVPGYLVHVTEDTALRGLALGVNPFASDIPDGFLRAMPQYRDMPSFGQRFHRTRITPMMESMGAVEEQPAAVAKVKIDKKTGLPPDKPQGPSAVAAGAKKAVSVLTAEPRAMMAGASAARDLIEYRAAAQLWQKLFDDGERDLARASARGYSATVADIRSRANIALPPQVSEMIGGDIAHARTVEDIRKLYPKIQSQKLLAAALQSPPHVQTLPSAIHQMVNDELSKAVTRGASPDEIQRIFDKAGTPSRLNAEVNRVRAEKEAILREHLTQVVADPNTNQAAKTLANTALKASTPLVEDEIMPQAVRDAIKADPSPSRARRGQEIEDRRADFYRAHGTEMLRLAAVEATQIAKMGDSAAVDALVRYQGHVESTAASADATRRATAPLRDLALAINASEPSARRALLEAGVAKLSGQDAAKLGRLAKIDPEALKGLVWDYYFRRSSELWTDHFSSTITRLQKTVEEAAGRPAVKPTRLEQQTPTGGAPQAAAPGKEAVPAAKEEGAGATGLAPTEGQPAPAGQQAPGGAAPAPSAAAPAKREDKYLVQGNDVVDAKTGNRVRPARNPKQAQELADSMNAAGARGEQVQPSNIAPSDTWQAGESPELQFGEEPPAHQMVAEDVLSRSLGGLSGDLMQTWRAELREWSRMATQAVTDPAIKGAVDPIAKQANDFVAEAERAFKKADNKEIADRIALRNQVSGRVEREMKLSFVDYDTRTNLDRVMTQIFPFWQFASRNPATWGHLLAARPALAHTAMELQQKPDQMWIPVGDTGYSINPIAPLSGYKFVRRYKGDNTADPQQQALDLMRNFGFNPGFYAQTGLAISNQVATAVSGKPLVSGQVDTDMPLVTGFRDVTAAAGINRGRGIGFDFGSLGGLPNLESRERIANQILASRGIDPANATDDELAAARQQAAINLLPRNVSTMVAYREPGSEGYYNAMTAFAKTKGVDDAELARMRSLGLTPFSSAKLSNADRAEFYAQFPYYRNVPTAKAGPAGDDIRAAQQFNQKAAKTWDEVKTGYTENGQNVPGLTTLDTALGSGRITHKEWRTERANLYQRAADRVQQLREQTKADSPTVPIDAESRKAFNAKYNVQERESNPIDAAVRMLSAPQLTFDQTTGLPDFATFDAAKTQAESDVTATYSLDVLKSAQAAKDRNRTPMEREYEQATVLYRQYLQTPPYNRGTPDEWAQVSKWRSELAQITDPYERAKYRGDHPLLTFYDSPYVRNPERTKLAENPLLRRWFFER